MKHRLFRIATVPIFLNITYRNQLKFLNQYLDVAAVTGYDEKHFNECGAREGVRMIAVNIARTISPYNDLRSLWKLFVLFIREKPDIVHTHTPKAGLLGMLAAWLANVPVRFHTVEGLPLVEATGTRRFILNVMEKITSSCATRVYANSHALRDFMIANRLSSPEKTIVLGNGSSNGIDLEYFTPSFVTNVQDFRQQTRAGLKVADDNLVFCFVGRLGIEKGIRELLEAFGRLRNSSDLTCKLLLVGPLEQANGALDRKTLSRIERDNDVIYVGRHDDIRPFLMASDVFVFPSYREGFPNVVMQAGAMGLPCIVSNINGCNEIVVHGVNGLLCEKKDPEQLYRNMKFMLEHDNDRRAMADVARKMISDRYQQSSLWESWLKEYTDFTKPLTLKNV